jgi:hypothetical protein
VNGVSEEDGAETDTKNAGWLLRLVETRRGMAAAFSKIRNLRKIIKVEEQNMRLDHSTLDK